MVQLHTENQEYVPPSPLQHEKGWQCPWFEAVCSKGKNKKNTQTKKKKQQQTKKQREREAAQTEAETERNAHRGRLRYRHTARHTHVHTDTHTQRYTTNLCAAWTQRKTPASCSFSSCVALLMIPLSRANPTPVLFGLPALFAPHFPFLDTDTEISLETEISH